MLVSACQHSFFYSSVFFFWLNFKGGGPTKEENFWQERINRREISERKATWLIVNVVEMKHEGKKKQRDTSTFHIASFKNPLGNICRLLCQLRAYFLLLFLHLLHFFSFLLHSYLLSLVSFMLEFDGAEDSLRMKRREIGWQRNAERLSGGLKMKRGKCIWRGKIFRKSCFSESFTDNQSPGKYWRYGQTKCSRMSRKFWTKKQSFFLSKFSRERLLIRPIR